MSGAAAAANVEVGRDGAKKYTMQAVDSRGMQQRLKNQHLGAGSKQFEASVKTKGKLKHVGVDMVAGEVNNYY